MKHTRDNNLENEFNIDYLGADKIYNLIFKDNTNTMNNSSDNNGLNDSSSRISLYENMNYGILDENKLKDIFKKILQKNRNNFIMEIKKNNKKFEKSKAKLQKSYVPFKKKNEKKISFVTQ